MSKATRNRDRQAFVKTMKLVAGQNPVRQAQLLDGLQTSKELKPAQEVLAEGGFCNESAHNRAKRKLMSGAREQIVALAKSRKKDGIGVAPKYAATFGRYLEDG